MGRGPVTRSAGASGVPTTRFSLDPPNVLCSGKLALSIPKAEDKSSITLSKKGSMTRFGAVRLAGVTRDSRRHEGFPASFGGESR